MLNDAESLKYVELSEESGVRTTVETSAEIFRGSQAYRGADFLAVEEPLEIQLAYGPVGSRWV
jgi:FdhD protein